jgi:hypothetical protein
VRGRWVGWRASLYGGVTNPSLLPTDPAAPASSQLLAAVTACVSRRGWQFRQSGEGVIAQRPEWPTQLTVRAREGDKSSPSLMGLAIDLGTMPLHGERFRDIFNSEREALLGGYGNFRVQQLTGEGTWMKPLGGRSFLHGISDGLSRKARLAVLDRSEEPAASVAERFAADSNRLIETGGEIAALLQRVYQRTVLTLPVAEADLPCLVRPSQAMLPLISDAEPSYPWRR